MSKRKLSLIYLLIAFSSIWFILAILSGSIINPILTTYRVYLLLTDPFIALTFTLGLLCTITSVMLLLTVNYGRVISTLREEKAHVILKLTSLPVLRNIKKRLIRWIEKDIHVAGIYVNPYHLVSIYMIISIISFVILAPISIYLAVNVNPVLILLMSLPVLLLLAPKLNLKLKRSERRVNIIDELPFFTMYSMIMQGVGKTLYDSFKSILGKGVFKHLEKEASILVRNVEYLGMDYIEALSSLAHSHPNDKFKTLLLGYTSVLRSGGDLLRYIETKLKDLIEDMKFRWKKYSDDIVILSEVALISLFIFPSLILAGAFIMPSESIQVLNIVTMIGIPTILSLIYLIIVITQPKTYDDIRYNILIPITVTVLITVIVYLVSVKDIYLLIATCIAVFSGLNGIMASKELKDIREIENDLPRFLRDITEYRKMGFSVYSSIIKIANEISYGSILDDHIRYVAGEITHGKSVREAISALKLKSWVEKLTWHILATGSEEGELSPIQMEYLIDFLETVNRVRRETKSKLRVQMMISFIAPIGLAIMVSIIASVMMYFNTLYWSSGLIKELPIISQITAIEPLITTAKALILISALGIGILGGKISSLTSKDTTKLFAIMLMTIIALLSSDKIASIFLSGMIRV